MRSPRPLLDQKIFFSDRLGDQFRETCVVDGLKRRSGKFRYIITRKL